MVGGFNLYDSDYKLVISSDVYKVLCEIDDRELSVFGKLKERSRRSAWNFLDIGLEVRQGLPGGRRDLVAIGVPDKTIRREYYGEVAQRFHPAYIFRLVGEPQERADLEHFGECDDPPLLLVKEVSIGVMFFPIKYLVVPKERILDMLGSRANLHFKATSRLR